MPVWVYMQHVRAGIVRSQKKMSDPLELELDGCELPAMGTGRQTPIFCKGSVYICWTITAVSEFGSCQPSVFSAPTSYKWLGGTGPEQINIHRRQGSANASLSSDGLEAALSFTSFWCVSHLIWRSYCSIYPSPGSLPLSSADNIGLCPTHHRHRELWQVLFSPH